MARFEVKAAWVMGIALPLLEVTRRRTNFHPIYSYLDDFLIGALLLWAAVSADRGVVYGNSLLCAARGTLCGGLYYSFFGQIASRAKNDISGFQNGYVILTKGVLFAIAIVALVLSVRSRGRQER